MLRAIPFAVFALLLVPIAAGSLTIIVSAFGWSPGLAAHHVSLTPFMAALDAPGFGQAVWLSLKTGLGAGLISLLVTALFIAAFAHTRAVSRFSAAIRPVLAVPHAAAAFGLAFLIAPSGYLMRLGSPWLTGLERPPDWLIVNDPGGWTMLAGLVLKEIPFLMFVTIAALPQTEPRHASLATSLGYGRVWGWLVTVFPSVYAQIRFPVLAVIAFASSNVDVAMVLGPVTPPPLAVLIVRWFNDPDINMRLQAAAAAIMQFGVTFVALGLWWAGERLVAVLGRRLALTGTRFCRDDWLRGLALTAMAGSVGLVLAGIAIIALWSLSGPWRFPDALPLGFNLSSWSEEWRQVSAVAGRAALIAAISSGLCLALVLAGLEHEYRAGVRLKSRTWLVLYLPLLLPQIAFLGGLALLLLYLRADGTLWAVILVHMVFVFPYVYLTLSDPWNAFDIRYLAIARGLGKSLNRTFWTVRAPMLLTPILAAFALGFAISIAQYLPTLLIGAGRQPTITTEAVALAAGGNRRLIGIYALGQTLLPFAMFAAAALIPAIVWRDRRALKPGRAVR